MATSAVALPVIVETLTSWTDAKILMNVFIRKPTHAMEFAKIRLEHFTAVALMGHMGTPL